MGMKDTRQNDAVDELVGRSADHPELRAFHALHKAHPEALAGMWVDGVLVLQPVSVRPMEDRYGAGSGRYVRNE
jgi:hypothetical protein